MKSRRVGHANCVMWLGNCAESPARTCRRLLLVQDLRVRDHSPFPPNARTCPPMALMQISAHPRMPAIREGGGSPDVASHALNKQGSAASSAQEGVVSSNSDGSPSMPGMHALAATKAGSDASGDHPMLSMLHGSLNGTSLVPHLGGGGSALLPGHPGGISIAAVASAKSKKVPWGDLKLIAGTAMIPHIDK
eukprot:355142-Chlamydomonas_euryale.AAC.8